MKKLYTMREALEREDLLASILAGETWKTWRAVLIAAAGEPLSFWERRTFTKVTGRRREPGKPVDELICVIGRRGGKSRAASVLANGRLFGCPGTWRAPSLRLFGSGPATSRCLLFLLPWRHRVGAIAQRISDQQNTRHYLAGERCRPGNQNRVGRRHPRNLGVRDHCRRSGVLDYGHGVSKR